MNKEKATARIKVFPSTHKKLRVEAAKKGQSLGAYLEERMAKPKA